MEFHISEKPDCEDILSSLAGVQRGIGVLPRARPPENTANMCFHNIIYKEGGLPFQESKPYITEKKKSYRLSSKEVTELSSNGFG